MPQTGQQTEPRIVPVEPASKDAFGAHTAIAKAILHLIRTSQCAQSIALIGERGSGKSTIVNLIKKFGADTIDVFIFDAWAHRGDHLRRAFLTEFSDFLKEGGRITCDAKKALEEKFTIRRVDTTERLTPFAASLAVAVVLVGVGQAGIALGHQYHPHHFDVGAWLTWFPLLAVLLAEACAWAFRSIKKSSGAASWGFLSRQVSETIGTPEPTSVEFRREFKNLVGNIKSGSDKPIVIVFEDLDRLSETEEREALAVLRVYTDELRHGSGDGKTLIWTLLPARARETESQAGDVNTAPGDGIKWALWEDLLEKLCVCRYVVPPPLVSDWRGFLLDCLSQALPNWTLPQREQAATIYGSRLAYRPTTAARTPRDIWAFANQVAAVDVLARHGQPVEKATVALFAANIIAADGKASADSLIRQLRAVPDARVGELAALCFGRDESLALQAAYEARVADLLETGDATPLADLLETAPEIGEVVLSTIERKLEGWSSERPSLIGLAAFAVSTTGNRAVGDNATLHLARASVNATGHWEGLVPTAACGLGSLCVRHPEFATKILQNVMKDLRQVWNPHESKQYHVGIAWLIGVARNSLPTPVQIPGKPEVFVGLARTLYSEGRSDALRLTSPDCGEEALNAHFEGRAPDEEWAEDVAAVIEAGVELDLLPYLGDILGAKQYTLSECAALAAALHMLGTQRMDYALQLIRDYTRDGFAVRYLPACASRNHLIAAIVLCILITNPVVDPRRNQQVLSAGAERYATAIADKGEIRQLVVTYARRISAGELLDTSLKYLDRIAPNTRPASHRDTLQLITYIIAALRSQE